jgi:hypothetical protein
VGQPKHLLLKPLDQCQGMTKYQLQEQIDVRRELMQQMVGWLYKGILAEEILKLDKLKMQCPLV